MPTDWNKLARTTDEEIERQIADDPDTAPHWSEEDFRSATLYVDGQAIPPVEEQEPTPADLTECAEYLEFVARRQVRDSGERTRYRRVAAKLRRMAASGC